MCVELRQLLLLSEKPRGQVVPRCELYQSAFVMAYGNDRSCGRSDFVWSRNLSSVSGM